jgi:hypothetical protein
MVQCHKILSFGRENHSLFTVVDFKYTLFIKGGSILASWSLLQHVETEYYATTSSEANRIRFFDDQDDALGNIVHRSSNNNLGPA